MQEPSQQPGWNFLRVLPRLSQPNDQLLTLLGHSSQRLFKVWEMVPELRKIKTAVFVAVAVAVLALLAMCLFWMPPVSLVTSRSLAWLMITTIAVLIGTKLLGNRVMRYLNLPGTVRQLAIRVVVAVLVARLAKWHLRRFNKKYLDAGEWKE